MKRAFSNIATREEAKHCVLLRVVQVGLESVHSEDSASLQLVCIAVLVPSNAPLCLVLSSQSIIFIFMRR